MDRNVNKYFTTKNIIFFIMIVLFLVFLNHIVDIALMFFAAFILSAVLIPFIDKLSLKMPRTLATSIILLTGLLIVLLIIVPLVIFSVKQGILAIENLPQIVKDIQTNFSNFTLFGYDVSSVLSEYNLIPYTEDIATNVIGKSVSLTKILINTLTALIATSIMLFYICCDKQVLVDRFAKLFPEKVKGKAISILNSIIQKAGGFVFAQMVAMIFVGVLTGLGLFILKNPNAVILGFVSGVFDIVPVIGPAFAVVIGLLTITKASFGYILITFAVYMIVQVLENQFLRPVVYGKFMNIHPLAIIMSLLIGAKFLGFWGVLLGPPIASVLSILIDELYIKPINGEETNTENKE